MLAAPVVAAVLAPKTLVASFLLLVGGGLALLIKPSSVSVSPTAR